MCCQSVIKPNLMISMPFVHICIRHLAPPPRLPLPVYLDIPLKLISGVNWSVFASDFDNNNIYRSRWAQTRVTWVTSWPSGTRHMLNPPVTVFVLPHASRHPLIPSFLQFDWLQFCVWCQDCQVFIHNVNVTGSGRNLQAWEKICGWESPG